MCGNGRDSSRLRVWTGIGRPWPRTPDPHPDRGRLASGVFIWLHACFIHCGKLLNGISVIFDTYYWFHPTVREQVLFSHDLKVASEAFHPHFSASCPQQWADCSRSLVSVSTPVRRSVLSPHMCSLRERQIPLEIHKLWCVKQRVLDTSRLLTSSRLLMIFSVWNDNILHVSLLRLQENRFVAWGLSWNDFFVLL